MRRKPTYHDKGYSAITTCDNMANPDGPRRSRIVEWTRQIVLGWITRDPGSHDRLAIWSCVRGVAIFVGFIDPPEPGMDYNDDALREPARHFLTTWHAERGE